MLDVTTESRTLEVGEPGRDAAAAGDTAPADPVEAEAWAGSWAGRRALAKKEKNFAEADRIREFLSAAGFEVRDTPRGPEILRR